MAYNGGNRRLGGYGVRPIYIYIAVVVLVLIGVLFVVNFIRTSLLLHFGAITGVLLVLANLRDLFTNSYAAGRSGIALTNALLGAGLILAWIAEITVLWFLWIPAVLMPLLALPLVVGRASVYANYLGVARNAYDGVRRVIGGRVIR